ncbi:murein L,D-transpeptidase catalytic domain-containing protein [Pontibacter sp. H249]
MSFILKGSEPTSVKAATIEPVKAATIEPVKVSKIAGYVPANTYKADAFPLQTFERYVESSYQAAGLAQSGLSLETFREAVTGYHNMMSAGLLSKEKPLVTVIDFNQSSKKRRLWVIDMEAREVLYNTWVAHGQGSGGEFATTFSNTPGSYQSSLGFYLTRGTYEGKNGNSLKLEGLDTGFNTNALQRYIVVHGAAYANADGIKVNGRLGRSQGCPALPLDLAQPIIKTIKNKTLLYIDGPSKTYSSSYLDIEQAALCLSMDKKGEDHLQA